MRSSGKLVVLFIFAIALLMAAFAWWWNRQAGRRPLEFWGKDSALAIRDGQKVELLRLQPKNGRLLDMKDPVIVETKDISQAQGLIHARHSLLQDASFDWNVKLVGPAHFQAKKDTFAVRFTRQDIITTIVFLDLSDGWIFHSESGRQIILNPKTCSGWKLFISRYFSDEAAKASGTSPAKAK